MLFAIIKIFSIRAFWQNEPSKSHFSFQKYDCHGPRASNCGPSMTGPEPGLKHGSWARSGQPNHTFRERACLSFTQGLVRAYGRKMLGAKPRAEPGIKFPGGLCTSRAGHYFSKKCRHKGFEPKTSDTPADIRTIWPRIFYYLLYQNDWKNFDHRLISIWTHIHLNVYTRIVLGLARPKLPGPGHQTPGQTWPGPGQAWTTSHEPGAGNRITPVAKKPV